MIVYARPATTFSPLLNIVYRSLLADLDEEQKTKFVAEVPIAVCLWAAAKGEAYAQCEGSTSDVLATLLAKCEECRFKDLHAAVKKLYGDE